MALIVGIIVWCLAGFWWGVAAMLALMALTD